jgi:hypothetical protein
VTMGFAATGAAATVDEEVSGFMMMFDAAGCGGGGWCNVRAAPRGGRSIPRRQAA